MAFELVRFVKRSNGRTFTQVVSEFSTMAQAKKALRENADNGHIREFYRVTVDLPDMFSFICFGVVMGWIIRKSI